MLDGAGHGHASLERWRGKVAGDQLLGLVVLDVHGGGEPDRAGAAIADGGAQRHGCRDRLQGPLLGALAYIAQHGLTYPNLRDIDGSFAGGYGTIALPETFVLDRRLHVVAIARGEITKESWLLAAIAQAERA